MGLYFSKFAVKKIITIQIYLLQDRYDKMNDAATKMGGVLYFEPLRAELHDCFGAIKNVQPDSVFSSRQGMIVHTPPDDLADSSNDAASTDADNLLKDNEQQKNQRERKSMLLFTQINNYNICFKFCIRLSDILLLFWHF